MAKIKCETIEDSTLVKFGAVMDGEVFFYEESPYYKFNDCIAINLIGNNNTMNSFSNDELVTYVKKAELKLTI